jgi:hypothetical protein
LPSGLTINRQWISVQRDGAILLDWGDGRAVDLMGGVFVVYNPQLFSHAVQDDELETLKRMGLVSEYDRHNVILTSMPEDPHRKIQEG